MFPIDMVYCWCDGNDPAFKKRKNFYLGEETENHDDDSVGDHRFVDNEELRYSLRSLEKYAPWIHHVYIVTDRQVPAWLNTAYDKVTVVDHSEIMPADMIPCFAASTIERYIVNIPGLSEHFLYGNDDMFFGQNVTPEFFFQKNGYPYVYVKYYEKFRTIKDEADFKKKYVSVATWMQTNMNAWKLLYHNYKYKEFYVLAHTIDGYCKSLFTKTLKRYAEDFNATRLLRFRDGKMIARSIFGLDMVYHGEAKLKLITTPNFWQKHIYKPKKCVWPCYCGSEDEKTRKQILRFRPYVFCVNADEHATITDKAKMKEFYEYLFPNKSAFENI